MMESAQIKKPNFNSLQEAVCGGGRGSVECIKVGRPVENH